MDVVECCNKRYRTVSVNKNSCDKKKSHFTLVAKRFWNFQFELENTAALLIQAVYRGHENRKKVHLRSRTTLLDWDVTTLLN